MNDPILESYAANQWWSTSDTDLPWERLIGRYLTAIALACATAGPAVIIGHIKAVALFTDGTYLRASVVSPDSPAIIEGRVPSGVTGLKLSLNVIVYGLEHHILERIAWETVNGLADKAGKGVIVREMPQDRD
jgi:hypothetical protein